MPSERDLSFTQYVSSVKDKLEKGLLDNIVFICKSDNSYFTAEYSGELDDVSKASLLEAVFANNLLKSVRVLYVASGLWVSENENSILVKLAKAGNTNKSFSDTVCYHQAWFEISQQKKRVEVLTDGRWAELDMMDDFVMFNLVDDFPNESEIPDIGLVDDVDGLEISKSMPI